MLSKEVKSKLMTVNCIDVRGLTSDNELDNLLVSNTTYKNEKKQLAENNCFFFQGLGRTYVNGAAYKSHNVLTIDAGNISTQKLYHIIKNGVAGTYLIVDNYSSDSALTNSEIKKLLSLNTDTKVVMLGRIYKGSGQNISCNTVSEPNIVTISTKQDIMKIIQYFEDLTYDTGRFSTLFWLHGFIANLYFCVENDDLDTRKYIDKLCYLLDGFTEKTRDCYVSNYITYYFIRAAVYDVLVSIVTSNNIQISKKLKDLSKLLNQIASSIELLTFDWDYNAISIENNYRYDCSRYKVFKNNKAVDETFNNFEKLNYKREMLGLKRLRVDKRAVAGNFGHMVASLYARAAELDGTVLNGGNSFVYCLGYSKKPVSITIKGDINLVVMGDRHNFAVTTNYLDMIDTVQKLGGIELRVDNQLKRKLLSRFISTLKYRSTIAPYTVKYIEWLLSTPEHYFETADFETVCKALVSEYTKLKEKA